MVRKRDQTLRRKTFERDNFTCRKCGLYDNTAKQLEAHHVETLCYGGENNVDNMITLCIICHKYAPNKKKDFEEFMKEESNGLLTNLMRAWKNVREENSELVEEVDKVGKSII